MIIKVRVITRSGVNEVQECVDGTLKVKLTAPPVDGQANKLLIELLSDYFSNVPGVGTRERIETRGKVKVKIRKSDIKIIKGETSRDKLIEIKALERT
ncbi:MAG: DUF167 domain-containing protein [Nitrospirae bacterium]|nr:DUF167 domain-containing protein [Nitrospirota bacterium]